jgi:DNA-directed RNA polymerase specialized sigma24 family protein|tara:strand:+ start:4504 stop:4890 length:387 start_codon:yes stop_codon:yes gene_type:complete
MREHHTRFEPTYWEVQVDQVTLDQYSLERGLTYESEADKQVRFRRDKSVRAILPVVLICMENTLTPRQREIVTLYFLEQKTEYEISKLLGVSVPSVSQHLFGKKRSGKTVGGAIPKLRKKLCHLARFF